jgi:protocatechuate 3,4-dioxygenase beta subunit
MSTLLGYRRAAHGIDPPYDHADYVSTHKRAPRHAPIRIAHTLSEITGPHLGAELVGPGDADLTRFAGGEALGERIIVTGRVLDGDGRPVPDALVEIWQANSSGVYRFATIKPAAYPWKNHHNAWRPAHIHFSLFGPGFATRLITQMYFPGDPLLRLDPIYHSVPDPAARERLVGAFDIETTVPERALGYRFDIVLRGRDATPAQRDADRGVR